MDFGVLGPLLIRIGATTVEIGAAKQRALLVHLLVRLGEIVPVDQLIDALWDQDPPPQARVTLRSYVSSLRRRLEIPGGGHVIVTRGAGYGLQVEPDAVDAVRFERLVGAARDQARHDDPSGALVALDEALALWRGRAFADAGDSLAVSGDRARLEELRLSANEDRYDALLALGRDAEAIAGLESFTASSPLRERSRAQLMLGLYRSGRAADALAGFARYRRDLVEELGLDPSLRLDELSDRILRRDVTLDLRSSTRASSAGNRTAAPAKRRAAITPHDPIFGREHEQRELHACVDRFAVEGGHLVLIAGEPGIGKTALLEQLRHHAAAADVEVHWGRCRETPGAPAFWPWIQIVRGIAAACNDNELEVLTGGAAGPVTHLDDAIGQRLGQPRVILGDDLEAARFQLYDALATFLTRAGERHPMVLLLDDLHWADTPTLQALAFLVPLLTQSRLLVAGSYRDARPDWAAELEATLAVVAREPTTRQVGLTGLQPGAVGELGEKLTGRTLTNDEIEQLHERTAGNPFFVSQLSHLHAESEHLPRPTAIPTGVRHVISRRLAGLPAEVRSLLEVAAVIGTQPELRELAAAGRMTAAETLDVAGRAVGHGLLVVVETPATGYRFVHALVRETIYEGLPPHRAAQLHAEIAGVLERRPHPPVAQLAEHLWCASGLVEDGRPVHYLIAAAGEALESLAYEQAETHLRRALELVTRQGDDPVQELRVRVQLVQLLVSVDGWGSDAVEEVAGPALRLARTVGLAPGIAPLWAALLSTHIARGELRTAEQAAEELLAQAVADDDPGALAAGHSAVAYVALTLGGDPGQVLVHAMRAEHYAHLARPEDLQAVPHLGAAALYTQALALAFLDRRAEALETTRRSVDIARQDADPLSQAIVYMVAGIVGMVIQEPSFISEMIDAGKKLCDRHGYRSVSNFMIVSDSWSRAQQGENPAEHAETMSRAVDSIRRHGGVDPIGKYLLFTAETYQLAGDTDAAARCLAEARALSERTGEFLPEAVLRRVERRVDRSDEDRTTRQGWRPPKDPKMSP